MTRLERLAKLAPMKTLLIAMLLTGCTEDKTSTKPPTKVAAKAKCDPAKLNAGTTHWTKKCPK